MSHVITSRRGILTLVATIATAVLLLIGRAPAVAAVADEEFVGVTSDLATLKLGVPKGGEFVSYLDIGAPANSFPLPCFTEGKLAPEGLVFGRTGLMVPDQFITDPATGESRTLRITGRMYRDGIATGELSISGEVNSDGIVCAPRSFSWAVVARTVSAEPLRGARYTGTLVAGQTYGGMTDGAGTVSLRTNDAGNAIEGYALAPTQACAVGDAPVTTAPLTSGSGSITETRSRSEVAQARHRIALSGSSGVGTFYIDRDKPGCRGLAGVFILAAASSSAPTLSSTPAAVATAVPGAAPAPTPAVTTLTGTFAAPLVFPATGPTLAQAVFLGGTLAQFENALRAVSATGAWAQGRDGTFHLFVIGAPAFINERFLTTFPNGFASTTALTLVGATPTAPPTFGRPE